MYPVLEETFRFEEGYCYDIEGMIEDHKNLMHEIKHGNKPHKCAVNINMDKASEQDPATLERIKTRILKILLEEQEQGNIQSLNLDSAVINDITIEDAFKEFYSYKEPDVSNSSLRTYNAFFKYLLFFCDKNKKVSSFTSEFFAEMNENMLRFPKNAIKDKNCDNKSYDFIVTLYENKEFEVLSNKYINRMFRFYKTLFDYFKFRHFIKGENPVMYLNREEKTQVKKPFSPLDLQVLTSEIKEEWILNYIYIAAFSGLRIQEIALLKKEHIDLEEKLIYINRDITKTDAGQRLIPIHERIFNIIECQYHEQEGDYLFSGDGNVNRDTKTINRRINKYIPTSEKTFHSLRKNFTQLLYKEMQIKQNIQEQTIQRLLGHGKKNLTFDIYNLGQIEVSVLRDAIKTVDYGDFL